MFDYLHYVPILRWKRAEKRALEYLSTEHKEWITPLIELLPFKFGTGDRQTVTKCLIEIANDLNQAWGYRVIFVDMFHTYASNFSTISSPALIELFNYTFDRNLNLIPVTGLNRDRSFQTAVANVAHQYDSGICLRLNLSDIDDLNFPKNLEILLSTLKVEPKHTDLVIDYGLFDESAPSYDVLTNLIPDILSWNTLTMVSGAFPRYLDNFRPGIHNIRRDDWLFWLNQVNNGNNLTRKPSYGDYTIQHPIYSEPPTLPNVSASIRYTSESNWVIMRGEGLRNADGPGFSQYPANALLLTGQSEFCGTNFSYGDSYIFEKSRDLDTNKTGTPETWLRAGINHHIVYVVNQLSNLTSI